ncbi:MC family mitochondrial carrier protein [Exophiala viscosa]|uniref:MC family mitochondrial carrier protein n=1 Tax=Exophiala viscosa TaxID=2486360 RepID=A0AAN6IG13_9EURO|nr:MC family mitochondrial carrier protein [Exophiala viscosa]KAI1629726.1 MC family mitochondrial carrier protein [Exophiala viscosa]
MSSNTNTDIWLAGAFAAFTVDLLVYPLDTLKTRLQSQDYAKLYKNADGSTKRSLFRGLYQGVGSVILITIPSSGAFFTTYEALKYTLNEAVPPNSSLYLPQPAIHAAASGGAELVSCAILTPAEVLKQNAQMLNSSGRGSTSLQVLKTFRKQPSRLWRGYTALAARNLPFTALQFPVFESLKNYFMARRKAKKGGEPVDGILERATITAYSAGIAGSGAAWITTPIDVVKTRIMLAAGSGEEPSTKPDPKSKPTSLLMHGIQGSGRKSGFTVAREVLKAEGVRGLFRGALLRGCWTALGSGLYLGCYEGGRFYLESTRTGANEGDHLMQRDLSNVKVGVGGSRSQDKVKKSAWQDD